MKPTKNNSFQIISGEYRGRKFNFPDAQGLRPTPGKVRETLFNWLQFEAHNKTYLDLFAGSGALSLEALSRGAKAVVSIEKDVEAARALSAHQALLQSDKLRVINQDAFVFLTQPAQQVYDLVFLDPPFKQMLIAKALELLKSGGFITTGGKIYIESEFQIDLDFLKQYFGDNIQINKQKQAGAVHYCLTEILWKPQFIQAHLTQSPMVMLI